MAGAIAHDEAERLRAALTEALDATGEIPVAVREAIDRTVDILETHDDAVVFAADATVSTQEAAALLGVSRMTVVRLIDRGELACEGATHRRIRVGELARHQADSRQKRRAAVSQLAQEIGDGTPPDIVVTTR